MMEESAVVSSMAATNPRWLAPEILGGHSATFASVSHSPFLPSLFILIPLCLSLLACVLS